MADSIRYPLNDERARLFDQAHAISGESTQTATLDAALRHYIETFENMDAMKTSDDPTRFPDSEEIERWATTELRFATYPRINASNETHQ